MTDKDKELIVNLVRNGKNTFKDLRAAVPAEKHWNIIGHPDRKNADNDVVRLDKEMIWSGALHYKPMDSDTFHLTDEGHNLIAKLEMEARRRKLDEKVISLSEEANELSRQSITISKEANDLSRQSITISEEANDLSRQSVKKAEASNKLASDSNDIAQRAINESRQSKWISLVAMLTAVAAFIKTFF